MAEEQHNDRDNIEPGMNVEATAGDLGENDISKPKVSDVVRDQNGNVKDIVISKGLLFRKKLEVPADRIQSVDPTPQSDQAPGEVTIATHPEEINALRAVGEEELSGEDQGDLLDELQREIPTAEGMQEIETRNVAEREGVEDTTSLGEQATKNVEELTGQPAARNK